LQTISKGKIFTFSGNNIVKTVSYNNRKVHLYSIMFNNTLKPMETVGLLLWETQS